MPDPLSFFGEVALRSSLVLATAFVLLFLMKRASASERHLVMLFGLLVAAFVPVGVLVSPKISWTISLPRQAETSGPTQKVTSYFLEDNKNSLPPVSPSAAENKPSVLELLTLSNGLAALIVGGMLAQMAMLGRAAWSWQRIRRRAVKALLPGGALERAQVFAGGKNVPPIFASDQITVPLLAGWLRPAILLPAEADRWPSERLVMVLCHELAHFRRGDSLLLPLICALRVLYWWHPLVWLALARLRRERENACDDLVLNQNFRATDYADLIVDAARQARTLRWQSGALAMASSTNVGDRIGAILNPRLNRRPASRAAIFTGLILAFALGWFFVAAQVQAEDQSVTSDSTAKADAPHPQIEIELKLIEINEKTYQQQTAAIDEAVKNGDISFLANLHGASMFAAPSLTTECGHGYKGVISMGKEVIQGDKSIPVTTFTSTSVLGANGKVIHTFVPTQSPGPSKTFIGINFETTPSLSEDGTILLPFVYRVGEVTQYKDSANWAVDTPATKDELKATDGKYYAYWIGQQHPYSLADIIKSPGDEIKTLPPLSPSPNRLVLIVVARRVHAKATASVSTAPPDASKPQIELEFKLLAIDEKTYISKQKEIDTMVANSDLVSLITTVNNLRGASLLSAPSVTTQDGLKANVDIVREFPYATKFDKDKDGKIVPSEFKTKDVGLSIDGVPTLLADNQSVRLKFSCKVTDFEGWKKIPLGGGGRQPVFDTISIETMERIINKQGLAVWVGTMGNQTPDQLVQYGNDQPYNTNTSPRRLLLLVFARPVPAEVQVPSVPSNATVRISLKYFQINEKIYSKQSFAIEDALNRGDMSYFNQLPGCLRLAEPEAYIKMGAQGTVSAKKDITYPVKFVLDPSGKFIPSDAIGKRSCGISVTLTPSLSANGQILLKCFDEITTYEGMIDSGYMVSAGSNEKQPVFNVSRYRMDLGLSDGKPLGLWARTNVEDQSKSVNWIGAPPDMKDIGPVRIGMIVTASLAKSN